MDLTLLDKTKAVLRSLLISSPGLLTINGLNRDYSRSEGHQIPFHRLGYSDLKLFLLSIPDILTINSNSGLIVPVTTYIRSEHIHKLVSEQSTNHNCPSINYGYQRPHPKIRMNYLPRIVRDDDLRKMDHLELQPRKETIIVNKDESVKSVPLAILDDVLPPSLKIAKTGVTIAAVEGELAEVKGIKNVASMTKDDAVVNEGNEGEQEKLVAFPEAVPLLDEDDPIQSIGLPISEFGTKIPNPQLTELKKRRTYNIFVTEIHRPWRFWFCLHDNDELKIMENQLQWHHEHKKTTMKQWAMVVGKACVVWHQRKWLRAEFVEKPVHDKVKVCFVDYGTIEIVAASECRYINKYFSSIPKRCFPGALEFIEPIQSTAIELKLVQQFCEMVWNKPLVGYVKKVDCKNGVVRMVLIDTSDNHKDVIINQELLLNL